MRPEATAESVKAEPAATSPSLALVSTMSREEERILPVLLRYFIYACIVASLMLLFKLVAITGGVAEFTEGGFVEQGQVLVLLSTAAVFMIGAVKRAEWRGLFSSLGKSVVRTNDCPDPTRESVMDAG